MSNLLLNFANLVTNPLKKEKKKDHGNYKTNKTCKLSDKDGYIPRFIIIQCLRAFIDKRVEKPLLLFPQ